MNFLQIRDPILRTGPSAGSAESFQDNKKADLGQSPGSARDSSVSISGYHGDAKKSTTIGTQFCNGMSARQPLLLPGRQNIFFLTSSAVSAAFGSYSGASSICSRSLRPGLACRMRLVQEISRAGCFGSALEHRPCQGSFASISTKAMRQGSVPRLTQAWLVPCWMRTSPALRSSRSRRAACRSRPAS